MAPVQVNSTQYREWLAQTEADHEAWVAEKARVRHMMQEKLESLRAREQRTRHQTLQYKPGSNVPHVRRWLARDVHVEFLMNI